MTRRGLFSALAGAAAAAIAYDPERALFVPGRKLISIAKPRPRKGWFMHHDGLVTSLTMRSGSAITRHNLLEPIPVKAGDEITFSLGNLTSSLWVGQTNIPINGSPQLVQVDLAMLPGFGTIYRAHIEQ